MIAVIAAIIFCAWAFYKNWLNTGGAVSAALLGVLILLVGGWWFASPMLLFFISGSLLGKLPAITIVADSKGKKARDYIQVLCNGGIAGICALLYLLTRKDLFVTAYFLSIAICMSDTWSSELGTWFGGRVRDITTLKQIPAGLSGGVSLMGTLAGFLGALVIGALYWWLYPVTLFAPVMITVGGFLGMLLDSILGSMLQAKYHLKNGLPVEQKLPGAVLDKGLEWMTNDLVNLLSNVGLTMLGIGLLLLQ